MGAGLNITASGLFAGIIFGGIGLWLFREGKRHVNYGVLFTGIAMMVYPYFTHTPLGDWGVGIALCFLARYLW